MSNQELYIFSGGRGNTQRQAEDILATVQEENNSLIAQIASLEEEVDAQNKLIQALKAVNNENQKRH